MHINDMIGIQVLDIFFIRPNIKRALYLEKYTK
ncbi:unnamed protein product [Commensalibacter communis]|nr:unnamed protein product [Commensalibacter communis]CAI3931359.1 unnamed protein product [Commensalibacter communis]